MFVYGSGSDNEPSPPTITVLVLPLMPMPAVDTSDRQSSSSAPITERFTAVQMPIDEPIENFDEAVEELRKCPKNELRRARQHHRRALESLKNGGYNALSDETREELINHLNDNLRALNRALTPRSTESTDRSPEGNSFISRLREMVPAVW